MKNYDVIIIGAGPSGIFCAYELIHAKKDLKVLMIEKGRRIENRECPKRKTKVCVGCKPCSITTGFAGAGAFSDGKLSLSPDVGGNLPEILGYDKTVELLKESDDIYLKFGADSKVYGVDKEKEIREIRRKAIMANLKLIECPIRHLGTEEGYKIYSRLQEHLLEEGVEMEFGTMVKDIIIEDNQVKGVITDKDETYTATEVISAVGREGADWFSHICNQHDIETKVGTVDIGVRVELPAEVFAHLTDELYESKIVYRTEKFEDNVRTFCMNPNGIVVNENTNGIITVNGHSYEGNEKKTDNTNFALLVAKHFSEPFKDSNGYGESIARLSNMLGGGVIVQRFGDLVRGRRSTEKRIEEGLVTPTLSATPGDLSLVLPKRILDGIVEMIYALDKVAPGTANDDTLLYGVEVKFYNMEVDIDENLESCHKGLYVIGDGSGVTHSLSHASASGVYVARHIIEEA